MVKVSVIIPTYHRASSISRAIDSVLKQTLADIEIIVVDDNGINTKEGENTALVMNNYIQDSRVQYVRHERNMNGSVARNTGIKIANGEYISFLDDDDIYMPNRLEIMTNKMDSLPNEYGACYTSYVKIMPNGKIQKSEENASGDVFVQTLMRSLYIGSGSNLFFRREVVDKVGLFDESFLRNQDLEYLLRVLKLYKMAYVDSCLMKVYYDVRTVSFSYQQSLEREMAFRKKFEDYLEELPEETQTKINHMYNLDWGRFLISSKEYKLFFKHFVKSKIPLLLWIRYSLYLFSRYIKNTSYGFYF